MHVVNFLKFKNFDGFSCFEKLKLPMLKSVVRIRAGFFLTSTVLIKLLDPERDPNQEHKFRIRIRFRFKKLGSSRIRIRIRIRNTG